MRNNQNNKTKKIVVLSGIVISFFFGFLAFRQFQWTALYQAIMNVDLFLLVSSSLLMIISFNLRAYRWKFFLPQNGIFTFGSRLSGIALGYFFSNILPGRLGDLIRPAYLSRINHQKFQVCFYSIVLERVWELVLFVMLALFFFKLSSIRLMEALAVNYYFLAVVFATGVLFLIFVRPVLRVVANLSERYKLRFIYKPVRDVLDAFTSGIHPRHFFSIIFLSIGIFIIEGLFFVCLIKSVGISIGLANGFMVMVISALSIMLPSAPAAVGVFHYFCQLSLVIFGVEKNLALSAAILIHAYMFFFDLVFALVCFALSPLRYKFFFSGDYLTKEQEN